jgi:hypothetical protein
MPVVWSRSSREVERDFSSWVSTKIKNIAKNKSLRFLSGRLSDCIVLTYQRRNQWLVI